MVSFMPALLSFTNLVSAEHVEARDEQGLVLEGVAGAGGLELVAGEDREGQPELGEELVLPLLDEVPGRDNQAPLQVAPDHELLYEEPGHYGLACSGVVGQEEPKRLAP